MTAELATQDGIADASAELRDLLRQALAPATVRAYRSDWTHWLRWATLHDVPSLPADPVVFAEYLAALHARGLQPPTLQRVVAAVNRAHKRAGLDGVSHDEVVRAAVQGALRARTSPLRQAHPLRPSQAVALALAAPDGLRGLRDRALVLVGFASGQRGEVLSRLRCSDLEFTPEHGVLIRVRRQKQDQQGAGTQVGVPFARNPAVCPVRTIHDLRMAMVDRFGDDAPVFCRIGRNGRLTSAALSPQAVRAEIRWLAARARVAGTLGPTHGPVTSHSLRAGHATSAAAAGKPLDAILRQTGHRSLTCLLRYVREGGLFVNNSADGLL